jgi:hypothetical protein
MTMGTSDGYVAGTTKIVDHGPDTSRWNLVFVGDGYRASELDTYRADVNAIVQQMRTTPPYDELFCGINVHRIDVVSTESGADDPLDAPDSPSGTATHANTYFDATFAGTGPGNVKYDRLLVIDQASALSVANAVPDRDQVICVINSSKYGGAGGTVATCSTNVQSRQIAIHEIGHSAFGLADEYGYGQGTPAGEPFQPNVTRDTNRATNKWRDLVLATTPMPSECSPSGTCTASTCVPPGTPAAAGVVGTFEGAAYTACNVYRPQQSCYMRDYSPFCAVCSRVIRQTLAPFLPAESISLTTPSISFAGVPAGMGGVGVTTHRAIVWETVSCRPLRFEIIAGPTGGFGTPQGTSVSVTTDSVLPVSYARLWLSYTSTNPGDMANGTVTVRLVQTGQTWVIPIVATTIARKKAAVSLVLDRSGSMNDDAGDGTTKVEKLREAANTFVNLMPSGDGIGLVRFNDTAQRIMEIEDVATGAGTAHTTIDGSQLDPSGGTSIGDGVLKGQAMLGDANPSPPFDVKAMVVLTDGLWNRPPDLPTVTGSITSTTYAVGLGLPSNISVGSLRTLCQGNNSGYLMVTGAISPDQSLRLSKYFVQIFAGVTNAQIVTDPGGFLQAGDEHRIPFWLSEADYGADLIVLSPYAKAITFVLEAPDGRIIDPSTAGNLQYVVGQGVAYYRVALPVLPGAPDATHSGLWHAVLALGKRLNRKDAAEAKKGGIRYEFVAHAYSALRLDATLTQATFEPGAVAELEAAIVEYDAPPTADAKVWAEIGRPDGSTDVVTLKRNSHGRTVASYPLSLPGLYPVRIRARGETLRGEPFEREKTLSAVAVRGGDRDDTGRRPEGRDVLECLVDTLTKEGRKRLGSLVDVDAFVKCLRSQESDELR